MFERLRGPGVRETPGRGVGFIRLLRHRGDSFILFTLFAFLLAVFVGALFGFLLTIPFSLLSLSLLSLLQLPLRLLI